MTDFRRYQLSTLVNRLLETPQPVPLDFLLNGQFLRTSLDDFLTQNGISAETTLGIEYVKALIPPLYVASYEHDDWVSSVDVLSSSSPAARWAEQSANGAVRERIVSGSYDGSLRVWNMSSETVVSTAAGSRALGVKAVKFASPTQIVSAGIDRVVRVWDFQDADVGPGSLKLQLELYGHKHQIDNLAIHTPSSRILTASADFTLGLWTFNKKDAPPAPESLLPTSNTTANKRRKRSPSNPTVPTRGPLSLLTGHQSQVSATCFDEKDATVAYSTSWDHSLKTWDLTTSSCVDTRTTTSSLYSLLHLSEAGLLATGTIARHITLIDPRVDARSVSATVLRGHTGAVASLSRDPGSAFRFVSGSFDGTCRVWDLRSASRAGAGDGVEKVGESVYVFDRESAKGRGKVAQGEAEKVFGVCWDGEVGIVSCGEDRRVQINKSAR